MSRSYYEVANQVLMVLMLVGACLINYTERWSLLGFLLFFCSAAGLVAIARRENALPLAYGEQEVWEVMRARGRRAYLLRSAALGFFIGLSFLLFQLIKHWWRGEPLSTGMDAVMLILFFVYVGGSYYAGVRRWALYEERYKESLPQGAQHNNAIQPTAR